MTAQKLDSAAPPDDGPAPVADGPGPESSTPRADASADLPAPDLAGIPDLGDGDVTGDADTPGLDVAADVARDSPSDLGKDTAWADVAVDRIPFEDHPLLMPDSGIEGEAGPSPTAIDSASDSVAEIPCDQLRSAYSAFLAAHRACSTVDDCRVVGGAGTCNCAPTLGNGSGDAVSVSGMSDAYVYLGRVQTCIQQGFRIWSICDAAPATNLRCEAGECKADQSSCLSFRG